MRLLKIKLIFKDLLLLILELIKIKVKLLINIDVFNILLKDIKNLTFLLEF